MLVLDPCPSFPAVPVGAARYVVNVAGGTRLYEAYATTRSARFLDRAISKRRAMRMAREAVLFATKHSPRRWWSVSVRSLASTRRGARVWEADAFDNRLRPRKVDPRDKTAFRAVFNNQETWLQRAARGPLVDDNGQPIAEGDIVWCDGERLLVMRDLLGRLVGVGVTSGVTYHLWGGEGCVLAQREGEYAED